MPQTIDNMSVTWTNSLTTYTGIKLNAAGSSDANSAASSLLMDLQVGGSSQFKVAKNGLITTGLGNAMPFGGDPNSASGWYAGSSSRLSYQASGERLGIPASGSFQWGATTVSAGDLILTRRAAANLRLGAADAAAPVAQTLSVQSVVAGTTNTAGANLTITGSQGTGTGAGGSIVFQVAPAGSSGTAQNALATALTIGSNTNATFVGRIDASAGIFLTGSGTYGADGMWWSGNNLNIASSGVLSFGVADTILRRDAANTLALRNGANGQSFRVYNTTDGTNSEFGKIAWSSNVLQIGTDVAGTGTVRGVDITIGSAATYNVRTNQLSGPAFNATNFVLTSGYVQMNETTAPVAAANAVRLYTEDNGSGKTRLMALFPTGAAVQIAIEP